MQKNRFEKIKKQAFTLLVVCMLSCCYSLPFVSAEEDSLNKTVTSLVQQLTEDGAEERKTAQKNLLALSGNSVKEYKAILSALPKPTEEMPVDLKDRLTKIRREFENRMLAISTEGSLVTLSLKATPLKEVLKTIYQTTENKIKDRRAEEGTQTTPTLITANFEKQPFWKVMDQILDQAKLGIYPYSEDGTLELIQREPKDGSRFGNAYYKGPFRTEATNINAQRDLRKFGAESLNLEIEISWEPRIKPISIKQALADLYLSDENNNELKLDTVNPVLNIDVNTGNLATTFYVPMKLPLRKVNKIAMLKGEFSALVPGRYEKFKFKMTENMENTKQQRADVTVTLERVVKNGDSWDLYMRLTFDKSRNGLESHTNWAFYNKTYILDKKGEIIDPGNFEMSTYSENHIGFVYAYDLPQGPEGLTWIYETPAGVLWKKVPFTLKNIPLP